MNVTAGVPRAPGNCGISDAGPGAFYVVPENLDAVPDMHGPCLVSFSDDVNQYYREPPAVGDVIRVILNTTDEAGARVRDKVLTRDFTVSQVWDHRPAFVSATLDPIGEYDVDELASEMYAPPCDDPVEQLRAYARQALAAGYRR